MATTVDVTCPKCGALVYGDYLKGRIFDALFFKFMRTSFRLNCDNCGFRKTYLFVPPGKLEKMFPRNDGAQ